MYTRQKVICAHDFFSPVPKRIPRIQKVVIYGSSHIAHEAISIRIFFKQKEMRKRRQSHLEFIEWYVCAQAFHVMHFSVCPIWEIGRIGENGNRRYGKSATKIRTVCMYTKPVYRCFPGNWGRQTEIVCYECSLSLDRGGRKTRLFSSSSPFSFSGHILPLATYSLKRAFLLLRQLLVSMTIFWRLHT